MPWVALIAAILQFLPTLWEIFKFIMSETKTLSSADRKKVQREVKSIIVDRRSGADLGEAGKRLRELLDRIRDLKQK